MESKLVLGESGSSGRVRKAEGDVSSFNLSANVAKKLC